MELRPEQMRLALQAMRAWSAQETAANEEGLGPLDEVSVLDGAGVRLVLRGGLAVHLGTANFSAKLQRLLTVVGRLSARGQKPVTVFLDDEQRPERVAVRLQGASEVALHSGT